MVFVELFSEASLHVTVIVYVLPSSLPVRSALSFTVRSPVICQSGVARSSLTASLLLTAVILQTDALSQMSDIEIAILTAVIFLFGGQRRSGLAEIAEISGGVVSCTVTVVLQLLTFSDSSMTPHSMSVDPRGKVEPDAGMQVDAAILQLSETEVLKKMAAPFGPVHSTV